MYWHHRDLWFFAREQRRETFTEMQKPWTCYMYQHCDHTQRTVDMYAASTKSRNKFTLIFFPFLSLYSNFSAARYDSFTIQDRLTHDLVCFCSGCNETEIWWMTISAWLCLSLSESHKIIFLLLLVFFICMRPFDRMNKPSWDSLLIQLRSPNRSVYIMKWLFWFVEYQFQRRSLSIHISSWTRLGVSSTSESNWV